MKPETFVNVYIKSKLAEAGDFRSGPVVKTAHFQCKGHRFDPWSRNWDSTCVARKQYQFEWEKQIQEKQTRYVHP